MRYPVLYVAAFIMLVQASLGASAQDARTKFNLTCIGRQFIGEWRDSGRENLMKNFVVIYRIDLNANRWCSDKCLETFDISHVDSKEIFISGSPDERFSSTRYVTILNRETGKLSSNFSLGRDMPIIIQTADCLREPFEGFPERRF